MIDFILTTVIIALIVCWIMLFIGKTGIREYVQVHAKRKLIAEMFSCDFCLSWWLCLFFSLIFAASMGDPIMAACAFCATPITRYLL